LIFKEKARCWNSDPEIQALVQEIRAEDPGMEQAQGKYSRDKLAWLKGYDFNRNNLAQRGMKYERLDQLTIEVLLGVR
jgi:xylose isomerase